MRKNYMMKTTRPSFKALTIMMLAGLFFLSACGDDDEDPVVEPDEPVASFTHVANGLEVTFTNTSTDATTYSWDFGDDVTSAVTSPTHTYTEGGTYNVTLTATGVGGSDEVSKDVTVSIGMVAPVANFSADVDGLQVTFTNTSTDATTYSWDFDDGETSTDENPTHTYAAGGTYTVELTATGDGGSITFSDDVTVEEATSEFGFINGTFDDYDASGEVVDSDAWKAIRDQNNDDWVTPDLLEDWIRDNVDDNTVTAGMSTSENSGTFALKFEGLARRAYQEITVEDGVDYTVTFYARTDAADASDHLETYIFNAEILDETTLATNLGKTVVQGTDSEYVKHTLQFTSSGTTAVFYVRTVNGTVSYLDDVSIEVTPDEPSVSFINGTFDDFDASGEVVDSDAWKAIRDQNNDDWVTPDDLEDWIRDNVDDNTVTAGMTTSENSGTFALKFEGLARRAYQEITVEDGKTYTVTFFARTDATDAVDHFEVYVFNAEISDETTLATNLGKTAVQGTDSDYTQQTLTFTASGTTAVFYARTVGTTVCYLDDVTIAEDN